MSCWYSWVLWPHVLTSALIAFGSLRCASTTDGDGAGTAGADAPGESGLDSDQSPTSTSGSGGESSSGTGGSFSGTGGVVDGESGSTSSDGAGGDATTGTGGVRNGGTGGSESGITADASGATPCTVSDLEALCRSKTIETITNGADSRRIYWNMPSGNPPSIGWPAVVLYQGSFFGPSYSWNTSLPKSTPFGGYYQVALIAMLIEHGFVVIQPEAQGGLAWNTNNGGDYDTSADSVFIPALLDEMEHGVFGPIDMQRLYATGISSGGYMTSRMAVSYPGRFRALAIQSGSYATCLGPICVVPNDLPDDHPPTLLLHGGADLTVPISTARSYYDSLVANAVETTFVEDPAAGHQWLDVAPVEITTWFTSH